MCFYIVQIKTFLFETTSLLYPTLYIINNRSIISNTMTSTKTKAIIFFIVLILSHEILHVEARHLKSKHSKHHSNTLKVKNSGNYKPSSNFGSSTRATEGSSKAENVDDFQPSGPGHSPGVGHSIHD